MHLPFRLDGTGTAVPATKLLSSEIDRRLGREEGWLYRHTGVFSRYVVDRENQIELAVSAARRAVDSAGIEAGEIDLILFAAAVPYQSIPATAPLLQARLGIADGGCAAFDINSTCLGFLSALDLLSSLFATGRYQRGLIVASEIASRALRQGRAGEWWRDFRTMGDILAWPGDRSFAMAQLLALGEIAIVALRRRKTLQQAATYDIEWNGEPLS